MPVSSLGAVTVAVGLVVSTLAVALLQLSFYKSGRVEDAALTCSVGYRELYKRGGGREEQEACRLSGVERDRDGCQCPGHGREADPAFVDPGSPVGRRQVTGHRVPRSGTVRSRRRFGGGDVTAVLSANMANVWLA